MGYEHIPYNLMSITRINSHYQN